MSRFSESLMHLGSWFHSVGAVYMKDHDAKVGYFTYGVCSMMPVLLDHMLSCVLFFVLIGSCRYFGTMPVMHLNVIIRILCSILCCIGNQCSFFSAQYELEYLFLLRTSFAQVFYMVWYFLSVIDGRL